MQVTVNERTMISGIPLPCRRHSPTTRNRSKWRRRAIKGDGLPPEELFDKRTALISTESYIGGKNQWSILESC